LAEKKISVRGSMPGGKRNSDKYNIFMKATIRKVELTDAPRIRDIYNHYIANTIITFETEMLNEEQIMKRIQKYTPLYPWYVAEVNAVVIGYAYASEFIERSAYKYTSEITIFLDKDYTREGYGKLLFSRLIEDMKQMEYTALISIIAIPNDSSIRLHKIFGFEKVGHLKKAGYKLGRWIDVEHWELLLQDEKKSLSEKGINGFIFSRKFYSGRVI
jgi:phosphinothricin acetyltransferase